MSLNLYSNRGYQKLTVGSVAGALTVPAGAVLAVMRVETNPIRWRDDGTAPTTTDGMLVNTTDPTFIYNGDLTKFKAIRTGSDGVLHVSYYGGGGVRA